MEAIVEAMRNIAFEVWKNVLLSYRTMVIKAELKRRRAIADSQVQRNKRRTDNLLLGQNQTDCGKDSHSIIVEDVYLISAGKSPSTMCNCDRLEMKQVFDLFDENKDGFISADELQQYMERLGFKLSDQTVKDMLESVDTNSDNCVDFEEFFSLYSSLCGERGAHSATGDKRCPNEREEDDEEGNLLKAFFVFDEDKDGLISVLELQQVLLKLELPEGRSLMSCQKMIERVDADGNGKVDFFEFKDMMSSNVFSFCGS